MVDPNAAEVSKSRHTISNISVTFQPQANNPDPSLFSEPLLFENYQMEDLEENYQYSIKLPLPIVLMLEVVQTMPESGELLTVSYTRGKKFLTKTPFQVRAGPVKRTETRQG